MNNYSVADIMEETGQKRGTVEEYRNKLVGYKIISNNQPIKEKELQTFKKAIERKENSNNTWGECIEWAIQTMYGEEIHKEFFWTNESILKYILWLIKNKLVQIKSNYEIANCKNLDISEEENFKRNERFFVIYDLIIDNFKDLAETSDTFKGSWGTDGNGAITWVLEGEDFIYYLVGKLNPITKKEEVQIFYNDGSKFNIMRCRYICGGPADDGKISEIWDSIRAVE